MIYKEHALLNLKHIFEPVEIIAPPRARVYSNDDFLQKATQQHLNNHVFANVHNPNFLNKLFFDFDGEFQQVERDAFILQDRLHERGIPEEHIIKIWTTKKGKHMYAKLDKIQGLFNPDLRMELKQQLKILTTSLTQGLETVDTTVMADLNRPARVGGIQRFDNGLIPVVISSEHTMQEWFERCTNRWINIIDNGSDVVREWGKQRTNLTPLNNILTDDDKTAYRERAYESSPLIETPLSTHETSEFTTSLSRKDALHVLEPILQPILRGYYNDFISYNPDNAVRIQSAYRLLEAGYSTDLIVKYITYLQWDNFNEDITRKHLSELQKNKKLRQYDEIS